MKSVAIVGASGYTGTELQKLLRQHRGMQATVLMRSRVESSAQNTSNGDARATDAIVPLDPDRFADVDGVFLCTPHGLSATLAAQALACGKPVVDLSADFRLRSAELFERTYGKPHPATELLPEAVYGLTEHRREQVASARLVANPGCYPTSILLPLLPLLQHNLVDTEATLIADSKSGVSGAGRQPSNRTHFGNVHDNFLAYGIGTHRHAPEIAQELGRDVVFTPHLLPTFRGILSTIYARPAAGSGGAETLRSCLAEAYGAEPFVKVLEQDGPELHDVQNSNRCHIAVHDSGPLVVLTSAIDNLQKGASGQALQNMNLMLGEDETEGLT